MKIARFILIVSLAFQPGLAILPEEELLANLLDDYDPMVIPPKPELKVGLTIQYLDIIENDQTLDLLAWMNLEWKDSRLQWNSTMYPNTQSFSLPTSKVWIPDIRVSNSFETEYSFIETNVVVSSDGNMLWIPPTKIRAYCDLNLTYWPHDNQTCVVKFASWVYNGNELPLKNNDDTPDMSDFIKSRVAWNVFETKLQTNTLKFDCCPENFTDVTVTMKLGRKFSSYVWIVGIPLTMTLFLSAFVFLLPPCVNEKILLASVVFVIDLVAINSLLRMTGNLRNQLPLIVQMVCMHLIIITLELLISVLVIRMISKPKSNKLPCWLAWIVKNFGILLCLGPYVNDVKQGIYIGDKDGINSPGNGRSEWLLFGAFIDRIFFLLTTSVIVFFIVFFFFFNQVF